MIEYFGFHLNVYEENGFRVAALQDGHVFTTTRFASRDEAIEAAKSVIDNLLRTRPDQERSSVFRF
jgi:hypothetical protein